MLESRQQSYQGNVFAWLAEGQPVEIKQYTGLKDKNDKEIYEGDILKGWLLDYDTSSSVVEWSDSGWSPNIEGECEVYWDDCEIIGNIYENPELVK